MFSLIPGTRGAFQARSPIVSWSWGNINRGSTRGPSTGGFSASELAREKGPHISLYAPMDAPYSSWEQKAKGRSCNLSGTLSFPAGPQATPGDAHDFRVDEPLVPLLPPPNFHKSVGSLILELCFRTSGLVLKYIYNKWTQTYIYIHKYIINIFLVIKIHLYYKYIYIF